MNLGADKDRLLVAIGCALVIHAGVAVGLSLVEWRSTTERTPLYVELSDPALLDVPEPEPPEEPEPEPEEVIEPPPAESEPEPTPEPPPEEPAPEEPAPEESPPEEAAAPAEEPAPAPPPRPQGPTEDDVAEALGGMLGTGADRERGPRELDATEAPTDDGEIARQRDEARREFADALAEEERYFDSLEAAGEPVDDVGEPETPVTPRIRDLIGRASEIPDRPSAPDPDRAESGEPAETGDPGDGLVEWDGDGDRRVIEYWVPEFDGGDLRAGGAREVRASVSFEVDAQGNVRPGSVDILAPGLAPAGRQKLIEAVSSWRFDSRPGASTARGSIDFVFERTG